MGVRIFLVTTASAVMVMGQSGSSIALPGFDSYVPITGMGRMHWSISNAIGPVNLAAGAVTSALSTRSNSPPEYGPHWDGFAKRNGMRVSTRATSSLIESSLGGIWGEDPRYFQATALTVKGRLDHVLRMTVLARNREGNLMPAYARYLAIPSSAFISNAWQPDSQTQLRDAIGRMTFNLGSRLLANTFAEFGPDLLKRFSKNKKKAATSSADPAQGATTPLRKE